MNILGIETSCDETAAAVVVDGRLVRSNVISSQIELHRAHGGVVPELAARGQVTAIMPVVRAAIAEAGMTQDDIDAVAFTQGPGLAGSLLVGVNAAKAYAYALGRPTLPVNHLEGHVFANWLQLDANQPFTPPAFPAVCLLVSGGHTEILLLHDHHHYELLGDTLDDAAGEAFDKGARLLGLGYPGGPAIQRAAVGGDPAAFDLPRARLGDSFDFSFSGLKTALLRVAQDYRLPDPTPKPTGAIFPEHRPPRYRDDLPLADLAASFEEAIVDVLATKTARAAEAHGARSVLIAGGVAANRRLRERLAERVGGRTDVRWPDLSLCTDNAAMVAGRAWQVAQEHGWGDLATDAFPRLPIGVDREPVAS
ncbi:MAG TPA: tRNA (adenosine(37)-N6)-threonylcarbamoyltransferase complex transferase subunit TsaD [Thermomicrobiales bacterium]|nr:tRNA (adenosine(37)-N6)-threonylcarbamoyltransferase complex transferase subunit TsaD [Thermomicrobiales bacterium]